MLHNMLHYSNGLFYLRSPMLPCLLYTSSLTITLGVLTFPLYVNDVALSFMLDAFVTVCFVVWAILALSLIHI